MIFSISVLVLLLSIVPALGGTDGKITANHTNVPAPDLAASNKENELHDVDVGEAPPGSVKANEVDSVDADTSIRRDLGPQKTRIKVKNQIGLHEMKMKVRCYKSDYSYQDPEALSCQYNDFWSWDVAEEDVRTKSHNIPAWSSYEMVFEDRCNGGIEVQLKKLDGAAWQTLKYGLYEGPLPYSLSAGWSVSPITTDHYHGFVIPDHYTYGDALEGWPDGSGGGLRNGAKAKWLRFHRNPCTHNNNLRYWSTALESGEVCIKVTAQGTIGTRLRYC